MGAVSTVSAVQNGADGNLAAQNEDIMVGQLRELDAEFNLPVIEQDLNSADFKKAKREGREPKLTKRYR
jgi:hypothetical protein